MQVYLPDQLYKEVKENALPASELLQNAVVAEMRRRELETNADAYLTELFQEVGEPSSTHFERANGFVEALLSASLAKGTAGASA